MDSILEVLISKKSRNGFALLAMILWYKFNWFSVFSDKKYANIYSENLINDALIFIFWFIILGTFFNLIANSFSRTYVNISNNDKKYFAKDYNRVDIHKFDYRELTNENISVILNLELSNLVEVDIEEKKYRYTKKASYYASSNEGEKYYKKIKIGKIVKN